MERGRERLDAREVAMDPGLDARIEMSVCPTDGDLVHFPAAALLIMRDSRLGVVALSLFVEGLLLVNKSG